MTNQKYSRAVLTCAAYICIACTFGAGLRAQSSTPPPASASAPATTPTSTETSGTTATGADVTTLEKYTVSDVPLDEQVLPTVRPISSVLGDDASIIDIPRSVSSVNKAWMDDRQIKNAMDFGQFSPGVYSAAQYGIPATPNIRGDLGQIYYNGQIGLFTRNEIFPSFNGVEALDVVKGPGSVVYGPQGNGPGGYVNFVTKQPFFDGEHTEVSTTLGYWASGHSYGNPEFSIDTSAPISDSLAYRVSWLERTGDGYYINDKNQTDDVFASITYLATKNLKFEWWGQGYDGRFNEVTGVNRVTQQFINNGTYIGGEPYAANDYDGNYSYGPVYNSALPGTAYNPKVAGSYPGPSLAGLSLIYFNPGSSNYDGVLSVLDPATAYKVKLPSYDALIGPNDTARAKRFQTQLITTGTISPDFKVVNLAYFEDADSHKFETYGYDEYVPLMESYQDRLEFHFNFDLSSVKNSMIAGADFRYFRLVSYQDYSVEPFATYDLYQPLKYVFYPGYYVEGKTFGGGLGIPGAPGYSGAVGNSGNQDSHIYDLGAFLQDNITLNQWLSAVVGARVDHDRADTASPSFIFNYDIPYVNDNIFPNGPPPTGTYLPKGAYYKANATANDPSLFGSLVFKLSDTQSVYASYNRTEAVLGSANYGGVDVSSSNNSTLANDLKTKSTLYEAGYKQSLLSNTLFVGAAVYQQTKTEPQILGPSILVKSEGIELDAVYQPAKNLTINANFTYQSVTDFTASAFEQTLNYLDFYPVGYIVDGQSGTGIGSPNLSATDGNSGFAYYVPGGRMKAPGVPQVLANFFVEYEFPQHYGIGIGPQIQGRQYADDQDALRIPLEYELDGYVFYRVKKWDVRVNVSNITNNRILDPIDVTFAGNDTIYVRPPIAASVTFRFRF
jgi:outer membrane receptor for monomeric catechols